MAIGDNIKARRAAGKGVMGWVDSHKGDDNSLTGSGNAFNNKIQDGLSDLINGALGIRRSSIPTIRGDVIDAKNKARRARQKANTKARASSVDAPTNNILSFPLNYFKGETPHFPNSIHFKSLKRKNPFADAAMKVHNKEGGSAEETANSPEYKAYSEWSLGEGDTYDIFLHLPEKLQDEVKVEYSEAKGGAMAQFMARLFSFGSDNDAVNDMQGKRNFDMDEIMTTFKGMMPGGDIIQKAAGYMTNPMLFQAMKNVSFRSYNYVFQLKPTSPKEASMIRQISHAFKMSMLPGTAGENAGIWTLPNEWAISFEGPIAEWVDFPLTCVCTSATIDYSQYLMGGDFEGAGAGSPSSVTLNLGFVETMQLSRQRYADEVSAGSLGKRVSRAEKGTVIGRNSYSGGDIRMTENDNSEVAAEKEARWYDSTAGQVMKWMMPYVYWQARATTWGADKIIGAFSDDD